MEAQYNPKTKAPVLGVGQPGPLFGSMVVVVADPADTPLSPTAPVIPVIPTIPADPVGAVGETVRFSHADLVARVEGILHWQMEYVDVRERVGRIYRVDYQPMRRLDPDLLVWTGKMNEKVSRFGQATADFQRFRRAAARSAGQWQKAARRAALRYTDAFAALEPTDEEAKFFAAWVRRVVGSHAAGHVFDGL